MGNAAAQNLVLKKYLPERNNCRFGEGKEVFEFGYDVIAKREMPMRVMLCSVRGAFGWSDLSFTEENLTRLFGFYVEAYTRVLYRFWLKHRDAVSLTALMDRFFAGFEYKTREMHWSYSVRREQFDEFDPQLRRAYNFSKKWRFALWSLDRQLRRMDQLHRMFVEKIQALSETQDTGESS